MMFKSAILAAAIGSASASFEKFRTFTPLTGVTDHAAISADQSAMETLLTGQTETSFDQAQLVYTDGGNSKSVATLSIPGGLPRNIAAGTKLTAKGLDNGDVVGTADSDAEAGATSLLFRYPISTVQDDHLDCRVGGLPNNEQVTGGCLSALGNLLVVSDSVPYAYTVEADNNNGRTLQGFSESANTKMRPGGSTQEPYIASFQMFFDYYGSFDYADQIISAGFENGNTNLANGNVNLQSSGVGFDAREEIVSKGTAYLSVAMYVIRELEDAIYDCDNTCTIGSCNDDAAVHALDEAVAFYYGSDDNFIHALANKRCANFATCEGSSPLDGDAMVNDKVFTLFGQMQTHLQRGECDLARPFVNDIATQIWIPIIQGTLRYAWILDDVNNPGALLTEKAQAEGAIFAAAVLPVVHSCDPNAAATIYENMGLKSNIRVTFGEVKAAFESCYERMGISCAAVGGLVNNAGTGYDAEAVRPCDFDATNQFSSAASTLTVSSFVAASILVVVGMLL